MPQNVGPPNDSVQLVQITPITMVYGSTGLYKPTYNQGAPHCKKHQFFASSSHEVATFEVDFGSGFLTDAVWGGVWRGTRPRLLREIHGNSCEITILLFNIAMENPLSIEGSMGKSSINWPFSMAMLNNQRV